jgi:hypothetical protein
VIDRLLGTFPLLSASIGWTLDEVAVDSHWILLLAIVPFPDQYFYHLTVNTLMRPFASTGTSDALVSLFVWCYYLFCLPCRAFGTDKVSFVTLERADY